MTSIVAKNKNYTSLSVIVSSVNYQELSDCKANSNILLRDAFPHFKISNNGGNVSKVSLHREYKENTFLSDHDFPILERFINGLDYDAITFIVPDPREILKNPHNWYRLLQTVKPTFRKNAHIIGYEKHFKVNDIIRSLAHVSRSSQPLNKLPKTNCLKADDTIDDFNDSVYTANQDFNSDGSVIPESIRY